MENKVNISRSRRFLKKRLKKIRTIIRKNFGKETVIWWKIFFLALFAVNYQVPDFKLNNSG